MSRVSLGATLRAVGALDRDAAVDRRAAGARAAEAQAADVARRREDDRQRAAARGVDAVFGWVGAGLAAVSVARAGLEVGALASASEGGGVTEVGVTEVGRPEGSDPGLPEVTDPAADPPGESPPGLGFWGWAERIVGDTRSILGARREATDGALEAATRALDRGEDTHRAEAARRDRAGAAAARDGVAALAAELARRVG